MPLISLFHRGVIAILQTTPVVLSLTHHSSCHTVLLKLPQVCDRVIKTLLPLSAAGFTHNLLWKLLAVCMPCTVWNMITILYVLLIFFELYTVGWHVLQQPVVQLISAPERVRWIYSSRNNDNDNLLKALRNKAGSLYSERHNYMMQCCRLPRLDLHARGRQRWYAPKNHIHLISL